MNADAKGNQEVGCHPPLPRHARGRRAGGRARNLAPPPNWRLEAALTGTLGSVPLRCGGRHLCLPVNAASSRMVHSPWRGCQSALGGQAPRISCLLAGGIGLLLHSRKLGEVLWT
jgi:hypothetical protein